MEYTEVENNAAYEKIAEMRHNDLKAFLLDEMAKNPPWARVATLYQLCGIFAFILGGVKAFFFFLSNDELTSCLWLLGGVLFSFTILIILHELIHAVAYYFVGARRISFGMKISKFLFYVQADGEVFDYKKFKIIALAPVVVVGLLCILGMVLYYNQAPFYFFLAVFSLHSLFCGGDFGMLCFFQNRPDEDIVTFDLKKEEISYFYKSS